MAATPARQTRGRQRIPMQLIQSQDDLYASFSKRRLGLFKKASELCTLCAADVGIIVFSPTDNPFSFFSPNMESITERYFNPHQPVKQLGHALDAYARARVQQQNRKLDQLLEQKLKLKEREEEFDGAQEKKGWWEETSIESLSKEQVREWISWFKNFKDKVENQIQQQQQSNGGGSTSSRLEGPSSSIENYYTPECLCPPPPMSFSGSGYFPMPALDMLGSGESSSHFVSSQYRYTITRGGAGGSPTTNVGETGQYFQPALPPTPLTALSFPPHYCHASAAQITNEAASNSNKEGNLDLGPFG